MEARKGERREGGGAMAKKKKKKKKKKGTLDISGKTRQDKTRKVSTIQET